MYQITSLKTKVTYIYQGLDDCHKHFPNRK